MKGSMQHKDLCSEEAELEDSEKDRTVDEELAWRETGGYYDKGWLNGSIQYFNKKHGEYKASFGDGSIDYIRESDIDGVELVLVQ